MGYNRERKRIVLICIIWLISSSVYAQSNGYYNSLVNDLLNACSYGYKGTDLDTGEIDFSNYSGDRGYIITSSDTNYYIQSSKGFFQVRNNDNEVFYTRNGEFVKRGDSYYLVYGNYKLNTQIIDYPNDSGKRTTMIFHPSDSSSIIRKGALFIFSEVECYEEEIIPNRLELPNINPIRILLKMKSFLIESHKNYIEQLEIINRMLDVLIEDKMHEYYLQRNYSQFDLEKYQLNNQQTSLDQLRFVYSTNWARTFKEYIEMLYM